MMISTLVSLTSIAQTPDSASITGTSKKTYWHHTTAGIRKVDAANSARDQSFANKAAGAAQTAAISTASTDATNKANASLTNSKAYTDARFIEGYNAGYKSADSLYSIRMTQERLRNDSLYLRKSDQFTTVLPGDRIRFDSVDVRTIKISVQ